MRLRTIILFITASALPAQQTATSLDSDALRQILARLDRLETENQKLLEEVRALRGELTQPAAQPANQPLAERVDVIERRTEEADQVKVQASQRFPLTITGMALFNAYINGKNNGGAQDPLTAAQKSGPANSGATLRQSILGLRFDGPQTVAGGHVTGALDLDLWGGDSTSLNHLLRLRTATISIDWRNTTISVGQDKPLIAPRDPDSLAQVSFSPLTAAGNPWLWQPQARVEQRFSFAENAGVKLQGSLYQTREQYPNLPADYQSSTALSRPGWEGRAQFWRKWSGERRIEIAPGFHASFSHLEGQSIASRSFSVDWLVAPMRHWELTGAFYHGQNLANIGGASVGLTLLASNQLTAVHQNMGWAQSSWQIAPRLKLNAFTGVQANRAADLTGTALRTNFAWGGNLMYRLAPNVITSFEVLQLRTDYLSTGLRLHDHYDLALAYLF